MPRPPHVLCALPAACAPQDLMQQTSWNLCPVQTAYSGDCYYDTDIKFDRLSGSTSTVITDMPDGDWNLIMRRDIFMKTRGAVRDYKKLQVRRSFQERAGPGGRPQMPVCPAGAAQLSAVQHRAAEACGQPPMQQGLSGA